MKTEDRQKNIDNSHIQDPVSWLVGVWGSTQGQFCPFPESKNFIKITKCVLHAVEPTQQCSFKLLIKKYALIFYLLPGQSRFLAFIFQVPERSCSWSEGTTVVLNWLLHFASYSIGSESTVPVRHLLCWWVYGCYQQAQAAPVMSCGCSRSAPVCSCGLKNSRKVSGVQGGSGSRTVIAGLGASGARWRRPAALSASLNGSGTRSGGLSGNDPSCPTDGLCWSGIHPASCAYCHCNIWNTHRISIKGRQSEGSNPSEIDLFFFECTSMSAFSNVTLWCHM